MNDDILYSAAASATMGKKQIGTKRRQGEQTTIRGAIAWLFAIYDYGRNYVFARIQGIITLVLLFSANYALYTSSGEMSIWILISLGLGIFIGIFILGFIYDKFDMVNETTAVTLRRHRQTPAWAQREFAALRKELRELREKVKVK